MIEAITVIVCAGCLIGAIYLAIVTVRMQKKYMKGGK